MSVAAPLHPREARFYELDILRGLAAIIVVIFHYKHFVLISETGGFDYNHLPFRTILFPIYIYGQFFVELFFSISGYVFFWLYAEAISTHRTGAKSFFIARFARLYPLYFVTLIFVAAAQPVFRHLYGADFIYPHNTAGNFLLNLFMVQQLVVNAPQMFNGPAWSISVEMCLYIVFFIICYFRKNSIVMLIALFLAGHIYKISNVMDINDFARGAPNFFLGGLVFYAVRRLRQPDCVVWRRRILAGLAVALPCLWIVSYVRADVMPSMVPGTDILSHLLSIDCFLYIVLPLTLMALGLMQDRWKTTLLRRENLHRWSWIGDISYSIYLLHFPLQLAIMMVLAHWPFAVRVAFFSSSLVFLAFFAIALGLAWLSHRYFEMPMQRFLRGWLTQRLAKPATAG